MVARLYLVPGFFGFRSLGGLRYFAHVENVLHAAFGRFGVPFEIHAVETLPTGTIAKRAAFLGQMLLQTAGDGTDPIHLVGHSTGALDARLLLDPERSPLAGHAVLERVRGVVSISGAHRGTPLANAARTAFGKEMLRALAALTLRTLKLGQAPVAALSALASVLAAVDSAVGAKPDLIDQVKEHLLEDLTAEKKEDVRQLFTDVWSDQSLIDELTPDLAQHFDAQTHDRAGVRYRCVVTMAKPPSVSSTLSQGLSPYAQASHALYVALHRLTRSTLSVPEEADAARDLLVSSLGVMPGPDNNDGIVPTLSQFHGPLLRAVLADHHDVVGNFDDMHQDPPHVDWLMSGTGFTRAQFEALWLDVASACLEAQGLQTGLPRLA